MNWATIQGNWNEVKGEVKHRWGKLTDDDLKSVEGNRDRLVGAIQQKYGLAKDKAEEQLNEFIQTSENWLNKAKENVKEVVDKAKENVKEAVDKGKHYIQESNPSQMATDLKDLIVRYPVQSALVGLGVGFMIGRLCSTNRG